MGCSPKKIPGIILVNVKCSSCLIEIRELNCECVKGSNLALLQISLLDYVYPPPGVQKILGVGLWLRNTY